MAHQVIAVIGAGGKTTAMELLSKQNEAGSALVTTTTHIYATADSLADPTAETLVKALRESSVVWTGSTARQGKLGILTEEVLEAGINAAELVIYEGDGANRHPLKLHKPYEPVILPQTTRCLILAGLSALGQPVETVVYRYDLAWATDREVGLPELLHCVAEAAKASGIPKSAIRVFLNQAEVLEDTSIAQKAVARLQEMGLKSRYGSLRSNPKDLYQWVIEG